MSTLYLIDGSSFMFRAFHALPPLTNAAGEPTGALFGVVNMLRKILREDRPEHLAFVFDASGPTFRDEMYADYKANRPPMPEDLRLQIEPLLKIVEAMGVPILREPGVEADDVIGTLARQGRAAGLDVVISTSDKDLTQLVEPGIIWLNTMSGERLDSAGVQAKFGVPPERIIDLLALMGDSVDNIPGVDKCGPKTAAKWLGQYDTLQGVIDHADDFGGKLGENLRAALPRLPLNRELVTVKTDCALPVTIDDLKVAEPAVEPLKELYARYGFKQALTELGGAAPEAGSSAPAAPAELPKAPTELKRELIVTEADLARWVKALAAASEFAFDTETTSVDAQQALLVGLSFAIEAGTACYIPVGHDYAGAPQQLLLDQVLAALKPLLEDPDRAKIAQNGKYDINVLMRYGINVAGFRYDTMLESYVLNSTASQHNMDALAKKYLGVDTIHYADVAGKGARQISFSQVGLDEACAYAAEDADVTLRLHQTLWPRLQAEPTLARVFTEIEMPLAPVLARMERTGVLIDGALLRTQSSELGHAMIRLQEEAHAIAGRPFSLDSPKQLAQVLYEERGLPVKVRTPGGQPSTNEEALEELAEADELPRKILDYRSLAKLKSTYTDKLPELINPDTGRVHSSFHQAVAATGRLSSSDPNLQNIPIRTPEGRRIRQAFVAPKGWLVLAADYSQIELRIMAHLSGDAGLLRAFKQGQDIHRATAAEVFGKTPDEVSSNERRAAKAINFGLIYGMSAFGLGRQLGIGRGEAQDYVDLYFSRYPGVREYMDTTRRKVREQGYVETVFGRRLYLPDIRAKSFAARQGAERAAINAPMQGTAADIIKRAMIEMDRWLSPHEDEIRMLMQVHDELVFEIREDRLSHYRDGIAERMSAAAELAVPLVVDVGIGANWDEAH
ncbi:MAG: DNA polymerase I [Lysobacterales bacterium]|nr:DNA polymerase I [Xanthomonadales bacterium]MCP5475567.1 DNA polymerase I [Rhodanobacteraceae bacterium]